MADSPDRTEHWPDAAQEEHWPDAAQEEAVGGLEPVRMPEPICTLAELARAEKTIATLRAAIGAAYREGAKEGRKRRRNESTGHESDPWDNSRAKRVAEGGES